MLAVRSGNLKWTVCPRDGEAMMTDPLCETVLERFRQMEACPGDWPDDWKPACAPQVRRESTIHRLGSELSGRSICVKIINKPSRKSRDSARLYAALGHYHARSDREKGYTVPEPYGCIPEHGAVIMEWVEGRTFSEILKKGQFSRRKRHENIRKVAGWLRWFHSQSEMGRENMTNGKQLGVIAQVFGEGRDLHKAATAHDPVLRRYLDQAAKHAGVLGGVEIDSAILHGDFKPTNLLFSRSGVVVGIDFLGVRRGPVTQDICRFLIDLDFYRNLLRRSYALSPGSRSNDFEAFLSGYGGQAGSIPRPAFVYLYFLAILSALVHQRKKFKRGAGLRVRLAVFRSIARQLSNKVSPENRSAVTKPGRIEWFCHPKIPSVRFSSLQIPLDWGVILWESDLIWSLMPI